MHTTIRIEDLSLSDEFLEFNEPYYSLIVFKNAASFTVNCVAYECPADSVLFLSPYQLFRTQAPYSSNVAILRFHGDFYCIEYHKKEVACNGVLFNNIYEIPFITLSSKVIDDVLNVFMRIKDLQFSKLEYDLSILKSYLQLILALCNKEKQLIVENPLNPRSSVFFDFHDLIDIHFKQKRSVSFYAAYYGLSINYFTKRIKVEFGKTPTTILNERMILEAKRLLHLSHKNINQIAFELGFEDEFYFSRFFKKNVGISPKFFRERVGIAAIAK